MRHWFLSILINKNSYFLFYINFIHNQVVQISVQCMVMAGEWTWPQGLQRRAQILQPGGWDVHRIHDGRHQGQSFDRTPRGQAACRRCYCCLWAWCKQLNIGTFVLANKFINVIIINHSLYKRYYYLNWNFTSFINIFVVKEWKTKYLLLALDISRDKMV